MARKDSALVILARPDPEPAIARYRRHAAGYDASARRSMPIRLRSAAPLNPLVGRRARPYMTTFDGLDRPWSLLEGHVARFAWESRNFGSRYIGCGRT